MGTIISELEELLNEQIRPFGFHIVAYQGDLPTPPNPFYICAAVIPGREVPEHLLAAKSAQARQNVRNALPDLQYRGYPIQLNIMTVEMGAVIEKK